MMTPFAAGRPFGFVATTSLAAPPPVNPSDATAFMNHLWIGRWNCS